MILRYALASAVALVLASFPAWASVTVYNYHIEHPRYGDIGTYSNTIETDGDRTQISTEMHVAVKLLGIVVHREDGTRTEMWQGDRLIRFDSETTKNGKTIRVHGEATPQGFVLDTPQGKVTAPANIHPSNPWSEMVLQSDVEFSTETGKVDKVSVSSGNPAPVTFDGKELMLKRYDIYSDNHQIVWLDASGVPVAFRTPADGTPVDFVLTGPPLNLAERSPPPQGSAQ